MANRHAKTPGAHSGAGRYDETGYPAQGSEELNAGDMDSGFSDGGFELDFSDIEGYISEDWGGSGGAQAYAEEPGEEERGAEYDAPAQDAEPLEEEAPLEDAAPRHRAGSAKSRAAGESKSARKERGEAPGGRAAKKAKKPKEPKEPREPKPPKEPREKKAMPAQTRIALIVVGSVLALLLAAALVCGYLVSASDRNLPNLYAGEYAIGGLTREQTVQLLEDNSWDENADKALIVRLTGNVFFRVDMRKAGVKLTAAQIAELARSYGHTGNWLGDLANYLACSLSPADIAAKGVRIDDGYISERVAAGVAKFHNSSIDEPFHVDTENSCIVMVKGAGDVRIDEAELAEVIKTALLADQCEVDYGELKGELNMPDFEGELAKLDVEPVSAYYDTATNEVVDDISGYSFDVDEAKRIWNEAAVLERIVIDLERIEPEMTGEALRAMLFRDTLGEQVTYFASSSENRINNINLACTKLSGLILNPGETFSYNAALGQRTQEAGFKEAGAYDDGQVVQEVGGGICQVSSTLYCSVMYSRLEITERTNHYFKVDYLPYGCDATVSWPKPDFKFTNNQQYPIKIIAFTDMDAKSLTIRILGTNPDGGYAGIRHESLMFFDTTYPDVCLGYSVLVYRVYYDAGGKVINEELAFPNPDLYYFHDEQIKWPAEKTMTDAEKAAAAAGGGAAATPAEPPADSGGSDGAGIQPDM